MKKWKKPWWAYCSYFAIAAFITGKILMDRYETLGIVIFLSGVLFSFLYFFNKAGNKDATL